MKNSRPWSSGVRLGAAAILGLGLVLPTITACTSPGGEETEQVEEDSGTSDESDGSEESDSQGDE